MEIMVITKCMLDEVDSKATKLIEKALRRADAGHRVQASTHKICSNALNPRIVEPMENTSLQAHCEKRPVDRRYRRPGTSIEDNCVHAIQTRNRFAQRPRRQAPPIHQAALVEHGDLHRTCQPIVLQAIVGQQQIAIRIRSKQRKGGSASVTADEYGAAAAPCQQQGFVAKA